MEREREREPFEKLFQERGTSTIKPIDRKDYGRGLRWSDYRRRYAPSNWKASIANRHNTCTHTIHRNKRTYVVDVCACPNTQCVCVSMSIYIYKVPETSESSDKNYIHIYIFFIYV